MANPVTAAGWLTSIPQYSQASNIIDSINTLARAINSSIVQPLNQVIYPTIPSAPVNLLGVTVGNTGTGVTLTVDGPAPDTNASITLTGRGSGATIVGSTTSAVQMPNTLTIAPPGTTYFSLNLRGRASDDLSGLQFLNNAGSASLGSIGMNSTTTMNLGCGAASLNVLQLTTVASGARNVTITNATSSGNPSIATTGGRLDLSSSVGGVIVSNSATPALILNTSGQGTDLKLWQWCGTGANLFLSTVNDSFGAITNAYQITRGTTYNVASHHFYTSTVAGTAVEGFEILVTGGANHIQVQSGAIPIIKSSAGGVDINDASVYFTNIGTTGSAANAFLVSGSQNQLVRSTSALIYKTDVKEMTLPEARQILNMTAATYRSRSKVDDPNRRLAGFIADQAAGIWGFNGQDKISPIDPLVVYNGDKVDGFAYERVTVYLLPIVKDHDGRIERLEGRMTAVEQKIAA